MSVQHEYAVLNTSRWESETILEWVYYYKEIGFDHIYIYCNDDDPTEFYSKLLPFVEGENPFITFHHMPYQGQQASCWMHFLKNHKDECEWFMFIDSDEFLALKEHDNIKTFMKGRSKNFDCIHFNWIWFGPQNFKKRPTGSTLLQFTKREDENIQMNYFTKTITRSSSIDVNFIGTPPISMINHRWPPTISSSIRQTNVIGEDLTFYFSNFPQSAENFMSDISRRKKILETACIYHYLFRSREDFQRRVDRGLQGDYYFQKMWGDLSKKENFEDFINNLNAKQDLYLHDFWKKYYSNLKLKALETSIVPTTTKKNIALMGSATQSSICQWSKGKSCEEDASYAINGHVTGEDGFHTDIEDQPWWLLDLQREFFIQEIRVFNSLKNPSFAARAYPLEINYSNDKQNWICIFDNKGNSPFGGADGHPLIIRKKIKTRFIKFSLKTKDFFHLDEVEIYA